ncbi:phage tail tape measure protein [Clostridium perfringens]|uniref:phage tail tape measure protein n=2 Tax=Clostridium perfringens TaxID=1502 RepID=UPI002ED38C4F|nr:phage tail tape measure protein [Clostridium perfringens]WVM77548.1 phage tail tape measure protein [Clostridium perfringens]
MDIISADLGSIYASMSLRLGDFQGNINSAIRGFEELNNAGKKVKGGVQSAGESLSKTGKEISAFGGKMTKTVTLPIVGAGAAAIKMGMDMEAGATKVSTVADMTKISMEDITSGIKNLSNETGVSTNELNEALYNAISASVDTADAMEFVGDATKLAKAGFADIGSTIDVLTTIMNSYGYEASEVARISDVLIQSQNLGKLTVSQLSTAMGRVIPTAKAAGVGIEQVSAAYVEMTKNGVSVEESTTYVNSMLNELNKSGTKVDKTLRQISGKSFKELMESGASVGDALAILDKHAKSNGKTLGDLFGSSEAAKAGFILAEESGEKFNETLKKLGNSAGSTEEAFDKVSNTTQAKFMKTLNESKNSLMEFGTKLLPIVDKALDTFGGLLDKFNELSPSTQEWILKMSMGAAVVGPVASGVGNLVSGAGALIKAGPKLASFFGIFSGGATVAAGAATTAGSAAAVAGGATGFGALAGGIGGALATVAPWVAGAAVVGGAAYGIYKTLDQDVVPAVDMFKDSWVTVTDTVNGTGEVVSMETMKISEGTKEAVQGYLNFRDESLTALREWGTGIVEITDESLLGWITKNNEYTESLVATNNQKREEELIKVSEFYLGLEGLDQASKEALIRQNDAYYTELNTKVEEATNAQNEIITRVKNGEIELNAQTMSEILNLENSKADNVIRILSEEEKEVAILQQRMKENSIRETTEQASEIIKKSIETKEGKIKAAQEEFEGVIKFLEEQKSKGIVISDEQYNEIIDTARQRRDEAISTAEEEKNGVVQKLEEMGIDLQNTVDTNTGEILSKWDVFWRDVKGIFTTGGNDANTEASRAGDKVNQTMSTSMSSMERTVGTSVDNASRKLGGLANDIHNIPNSKTVNITVNETFKQYGRPTAGGNQMGRYNTGTRSFEGGRAIVHDSMTMGTGEIMDLPGGTRIYPHDVSIQMAREAAKEVAKEFAKQNKQTSSGGNLTLSIKEFINNREQDIEDLADELAFYLKERGLGGA